MYSITSESASHPDILALIAALDSYQTELYPAESNHLVDLTQLAAGSLLMMVIRDNHLNALGCGAIVLIGAGNGCISIPPIADKSLGKNCWLRWKTKP